MNHNLDLGFSRGTWKKCQPYHETGPPFRALHQSLELLRPETDPNLRVMGCTTFPRLSSMSRDRAYNHFIMLMIWGYLSTPSIYLMVADGRVHLGLSQAIPIKIFKFSCMRQTHTGDWGNGSYAELMVMVN